MVEIHLLSDSKSIDWAGYSENSNIRKELVFASNYVAELTEKNESHATLLSCCLVVTTDILWQP